MPDFIPFFHDEISVPEQRSRAQRFYELCNKRRSIREFSDKPVDKSLLELIVRTANTAPSGANKQP